MALTEEQKKEVDSLYAAGFKAQSIAEKTGYDYKSVRIYLQNLCNRKKSEVITIKQAAKATRSVEITKKVNDLNSQVLDLALLASKEIKNIINPPEDKKSILKTAFDYNQIMKAIESVQRIHRKCEGLDDKDALNKDSNSNLENLIDCIKKSRESND